MNIDYPLHDDDIVTVNECGHILEITYLSSRSKGSNITKLSKDYYMNSEGEVFEFNHLVTRLDDYDNVRRSMKQARDRINANCVYPERLRWLTLTYAENMQDVDRLYQDFKLFIRRMHFCYSDFEYICAVEPQARGAWHCHVILIFPDQAPFLKNSVVADCWKQGFVNVQAVDNIDNLGAYLSAYMADVEIEEAKDEHLAGQIIERVVDGKPKKYIKGARLSMYPAGMHIFRYSKGIKLPVVSIMPYSKARDIISGKKLTFESVSSFGSDDFTCTVKKEYYNG